MYAVIKTGGKQYRVSPGDVFVVDKLLGDAGAKIKLDKVMMVGEDGKSPEVGIPILSSTAVNCEVIEQSRSDKVIVFKKKRRQGYKRTKGHRQEQTVLRVLDINGKGAVKASPKKAVTSKEKKPKEVESPTSDKSKAGDTKAKAPAAKAKPPAAKAKPPAAKAKPPAAKAKPDTKRKTSAKKKTGVKKE